MKLFDNEQLISQSDNNQVVLTSKRIRQTENGKDITSIMLEKISSIEVRHQSFIVALVAGIIILAVAFFMLKTDEGAAQVTAVVGVVLILFYFFTRKHIISISSDGGAKIVLVTLGMNHEGILDFVHQIEQAKMDLHQKV